MVNLTENPSPVPQLPIPSEQSIRGISPLMEGVIRLQLTDKLKTLGDASRLTPEQSQQELNYLKDRLAEGSGGATGPGRQKVNLKDPDRLWVALNILYPKDVAGRMYLIIRPAQIMALGEGVDIPGDWDSERIHRELSKNPNNWLSILNQRQTLAGEGAVLKLMSDAVRTEGTDQTAPPALPAHFVNSEKLRAALDARRSMLGRRRVPASVDYKPVSSPERKTDTTAEEVVPLESGEAVSAVPETRQEEVGNSFRAARDAEFRRQSKPNLSIPKVAETTEPAAATTGDTIVRSEPEPGSGDKLVLTQEDLEDFFRELGEQKNPPAEAPAVEAGEPAEITQAEPEKQKEDLLDRWRSFNAAPIDESTWARRQQLCRETASLISSAHIPEEFLRVAPESGILLAAFDQGLIRLEDQDVEIYRQREDVARERMEQAIKLQASELINSWFDEAIRSGDTRRAAAAFELMSKDQQVSYREALEKFYQAVDRGEIMPQQEKGNYSRPLLESFFSEALSKGEFLRAFFVYDLMGQEQQEKHRAELEKFAAQTDMQTGSAEGQ